MTPFLDETAVFVFGSNRAGIHGAGAARFARQCYGAESSVGEGPTGRAYAVPTKDMQLKSLRLPEIAEGIKAFSDYASVHEDLSFQVTRIGCGLAGYSDGEVAGFFREHTPNMMLPGRWALALGECKPRVIVAGTRCLVSDSHRARLFNALDKTAEKIGEFEVVSGLASGPDTFGLEWARSRGFEQARFPARWDRWGKPAGFRRNTQMAWYGTHLVALYDGVSRGTAGMIKTAHDHRKLRAIPHRFNPTRMLQRTGLILREKTPVG